MLTHKRWRERMEFLDCHCRMSSYSPVSDGRVGAHRAKDFLRACEFRVKVHHVQIVAARDLSACLPKATICPAGTAQAGTELNRGVD